MLDKILKLIEAGYTHDEINAILNSSAAPAPAAPDAHDAPAAPGAPAAPAAGAAAGAVPGPGPAAVPAAGAAAGAAAPGPADMGAILAAIQGMGNNIVAALQRAQIGAATLTPPDPMNTLDEITAAIIDPPMKGDIK